MNAAGEARSHDPRRDGPPPVPPPPAPPSGPPAGRPGEPGRGPTPWTAWLTPRLVFGLFVAGLGAVLFLEQFGFDLDPLLRWWPAALILLGAIKVTQSQGRTFGAVLTVIGTLLLLDNLELVRVDDLDRLWPLFVIALGGFLVWGGLRGARRRGAAAVDVAATFHALAVMGGVRRQITSKAFVGGDASAVMGGCEIDLRHAEMAGEEAEIEVFAMWGGVDLAVPDHWRVEIRGMPLMGAFEDTTRPRTEDATKRLIVRGLALMGGVEITSQLGKSG
jgi:hypothetical protein